ncbi:MAG: hypothetical protein ACYTEL_11295 [Planctomycetota bacterium]|jgi:hypothetical protein
MGLLARRSSRLLTSGRQEPEISNHKMSPPAQYNPGRRAFLHSNSGYYRRLGTGAGINGVRLNYHKNILDFVVLIWYIGAMEGHFREEGPEHPRFGWVFLLGY